MAKAVISKLCGGDPKKSVQLAPLGPPSYCKAFRPSTKERAGHSNTASSMSNMASGLDGKQFRAKGADSWQAGSAVTMLPSFAQVMEGRVERQAVARGCLELGPTQPPQPHVPPSATTSTTSYKKAMSPTGAQSALLIDSPVTLSPSGEGPRSKKEASFSQFCTMAQTGIKRFFACLDDDDSTATDGPQPAHRFMKGSSRSAAGSAKKLRLSSRTNNALRNLTQRLHRNPATTQRSFKGPTDAAPHIHPEDADDDADEAPTWDDDARRWGPVLSIPDAALASLVRIFTFSTLNRSATAVAVIKRTAGRDNAVYTVQYYLDGGRAVKVCVRVPACGWGDRWQPSDASALRNVALTMRYVGQHSRIPVPVVLQYDTTLNNAIGAPYIMTSCVEGRPLPDVWYGAGSNTNTSVTLEQKRQNILRTLAAAAASLRFFTFPQMGPLLFDEHQQHPHIDEAVMASFGRPAEEVVDEKTAVKSKRIKRRRKQFNPRDHLSSPEPDSRAFFFRCLDAARAYAIDREETPEVRGVFALVRVLMEEMPWPTWSNSNTMTTATMTTLTNSAGSDAEKGEEGRKGETFVLAPPADFDAANVLVDERSGAVVGVVDWDGFETQPLMLGWASCPDLLASDWTGGVSWPRPGYEEVTMATRRLLEEEDGRGWDAYRVDYMEYLREAVGGDGDGCVEVYARKSHLYQAVLRSLNDLDRLREVLDRVLEEALPRVRRTEMIAAVGEAGLSAEQERFVRGRFRELLT